MSKECLFVDLNWYNKIDGYRLCHTTNGYQSWAWYSFPDKNTAMAKGLAIATIIGIPFKVIREKRKQKQETRYEQNDQRGNSQGYSYG